MIGDDIVGDTGAAQACGIHGIQVKTGKFRDADLGGRIKPDFLIDSIADLPRGWQQHLPQSGQGEGTPQRARD